MVAIETKFIPVTDTRGSRIKASANGNSVTLVYRHDMNSEQNHRFVAEKLAEKMHWVGPAYGRLIGGGTDKGYVFVFEKSDI